MSQSVNKNKFRIGIIGLGYVGLPLAIELGKKFVTVGYDKDSLRIKELTQNHDRTLEINKDELKKSKLELTNNYRDLDSCNFFIVTVPTPIDKYNVPDLSPLASASELIGKMLKKDDVVIYESTVYPGATEEFCVPILERTSGLKYNKDFSCGYSPERINPGDKEHTLTSIRKIISASNDTSLMIVKEIYSSIIKAGIYEAPSIRVAEAAKVIENIQRDVNIALINELSMLFHALEIDTLDVLEAAGSKWNFLPFRPGLVGGHCIGVDPYYLTYKSSEIGYNPQLILSGRKVNDGMGKYIANSTISQMLTKGINPQKSRILIMGLTFKENCPDMRNSKTWDIINSLDMFNCDITITDPYQSKENIKKITEKEFVDLESAKSFDVAIVSVAHQEYKKLEKNKWKEIINFPGLIIDVKSAFDKDFFISLNLNHWRL